MERPGNSLSVTRKVHDFRHWTRRAEEGLKFREINQHNRMYFALEPTDLKNTVESTFSTIYDSFLILYDINEDNNVSQKSRIIVLNLNQN